MATTIPILGALACLASGLGFTAELSQDNGVGKPAPAFTATGNDGKTHTLESLTKGSTLVLYFIKDGCPVNSDAIQYVNKISAAYKDNVKVKLVGVFNGDAKAFERFNSRFKVPYLVLYDPGYSLIKSYGAKYSPWLTRVAEGKVAKVYPGYSVESLADLNALMARDGGVAKAAISFEGAPAQETFG